MTARLLTADLWIVRFDGGTCDRRRWSGRAVGGMKVGTRRRKEELSVDRRRRRFFLAGTLAELRVDGQVVALRVLRSLRDTHGLGH